MNGIVCGETRNTELMDWWLFQCQEWSMDLEAACWTNPNARIMMGIWPVWLIQVRYSNRAPKMRSFHKQKPCTWVSSQVTFIRNVLEEVGVGVYSFQKWLLHTQAYNITNTRKKLCKPSSCFIWEARLSKNGLPLRSNGSSSFSWWKRSILAYTLFWTKQYKDLRSLPIDWSSSESIEFPEYPMFTIFGYVPY